MTAWTWAIIGVLAATGCSSDFNSCKCPPVAPASCCHVVPTLCEVDTESKKPVWVDEIPVRCNRVFLVPSVSSRDYHYCKVAVFPNFFAAGIDTRIVSYDDCVAIYVSAKVPGRYRIVFDANMPDRHITIAHDLTVTERRP